MSEETARPLSVGEWFVTLLILAIPLVGVVMYLYWAFADGVNENKRNFCRAGLLWFVVVCGVAFLSLMMIGGLAAVAGNSG